MPLRCGLSSKFFDLFRHNSCFVYYIHCVFTDADSTLAINLFSAKDSDQLLSGATCFQYIKQSSSTALSVFSLETSLVNHLCNHLWQCF